MGLGRYFATRFKLPIKKDQTIQVGVYKITLTSGKQYVIKRMEVPVNTLRWIDRTLHRMREHGFHHMSWRQADSRYGRRLYIHSHLAPYVLTPWIKGRWPAVFSKRDLHRCGVTLAKFHQSATNIPLRTVGSINSIGKWSAMLQKRHQVIVKSMHIAGTMITKAERAAIMNYSLAAKRSLRQQGFNHWNQAQQHLITLCHGDVGPTNFILNKRGVHLIDFETLRIDYRAYDLSRALYNFGQFNRFSYAPLKAFLDGYQTISRLEKTDLAMASALLRFPRMTYLALLEYIKNPRKKKRKFLMDYPKAIRMERRMTAFLAKLNQYV